MKLLLEPVIETRRLLLRPPRPADIDALVAAIGDLRVSRTLGRVPHPYTRADGESFVAAVRRNARGGKSLNLSIFHEGRLIGGIGIGNLPGYCEFGYWLAYEAWGKGFATEAGRAVLAYAFDVLGLDLIRSGILAGNVASMRVQTKLGLRRVGISRRHALARDEMVDHIDTILPRARFKATTR
jgi:RimJ/RimL family protein N-acetyltransferase